jgi:hypothetical protein
MTTKEGHRFFETVPWRVQPVHAAEYPVRMLRLLGRRRAGIPLDDDSSARLDSWLAMLERERVVVAYAPEGKDGFLYVDERFRGGPNPNVPIRVQAVRAWEVKEPA